MRVRDSREQTGIQTKIGGRVEKTVQRLRALFNGLQRAHGEYTISGKKSPRGKTQGKAKTVIEAITDLHWQSHIEGVQGLGIVPIMDDAKCGFGALDIDSYSLDLVELEQKISSLHLPLVVCRTKSGGAHLYLFLQEPVSAELVRIKLADWAIALGHPGVEVFPKQDAMANADDVGNWINIPYFNAQETERYAVVNGEPLSLEEFLDVAEKVAVSLETLNKIDIQLVDKLADAPPCLQSLCANGIPEGSRNDVMYGLGVFAKLKYEDDWEEQLDAFNADYLTPMLGHVEMNDIARSLNKKEYFYACKREPFKSKCNLQICKMREYGVGKGEATDPGVLIEGITQITTEPPIWFVSVNGTRLQISSEDLLNQTRFARRVMDQLRIVPQPLKSHKWRELINNLLKTAEVVIAPQDAGPEGLFWHYLEQFCTQRAQARRRDELLLGKPWTENNRTYFRSADLMRFLEMNKFREYRANHVYAVLRKRKSIKHEQFNLKGQCVQCWSIDEFPRQDAPFERPEEVGSVDC